MYCRKCGLYIEEYLEHCPRCGAPLNYSQHEQPNAVNSYEHASDDHSSFGFAFLSFILPLIGVFLFAIMVKSSPKRAKSCLRGAITNLLLVMVTIAIFLILAFLNLY